MKNFEQLAQQIWSVSSLDEKKQLLGEMVNQFQYKAKQEEFRRKVSVLSSNRKADKLASDIMLADSMKVTR